MKKGSKIALVLLVIAAVCGIGGWKYYEAQIAKMQDAGVESLMSIVNTDDYREAEKKEIEDILKSTEAKIRKSKDEGEIEGYVKDASTQISEFKTDAQYTEEEEAARKAEEERKRKEEEERIAAEQAAAARNSDSGGSSGGGGGGGGCVGGGSDAFY